MTRSTAGQHRRSGGVADRPGASADTAVDLATTKGGTDLSGPGDPDPVGSTSPASAERMCRIIAARAAAEAAHAELRAAVRAAREAGDSWATIGATLGTARVTFRRVFPNFASQSPKGRSRS